MSFNILFSQLYLIRHSGVTWVAGDEQTVFLPGARHFQCPLPSELLLLVWRRFCAARLLVCVSCVCFVSLLVYFYFPLPPSMGQRLTTPLSLTLRHWKEVKDRANSLSVEVRRKKWQTFCSSEWPTLDVEWPQDGTFNIDCILQVKERVFDAGPHGHSDQVPYIITWESLVLDPPPWVAPFVTKKPRVPNAIAMMPTAPPAQSSIYPLLEKEKLEARPNPILPPEDPVLIDLLSENPCPYQAPQRPAPLPAGPSPASAETRFPDTTSPVVDEGTSAPSPVTSRLRLRRVQGRERRENGKLRCSL